MVPKKIPNRDGTERIPMTVSQGKTTGSEDVFFNKDAVYDFLIDSFGVCHKIARAMVQEAETEEDLLLVLRMIEWVNTNWKPTKKFIEFKMNCSNCTDALVRQYIIEFCEGARARAESSAGNLEEVRDYLDKIGLSLITPEVGELPRAVREITGLVSYFPLQK